MIHISEDQRLFILRTNHAVWRIRVNDQGHVLHEGFAPACPASDAEGLAQPLTPIKFDFSFDLQGAAWEFPTCGDVGYRAVALRAAFPEPPPGAPRAGEAAHLPVRDLRLRFSACCIEQDAQPGCAPAHGQPTRDTSPRETLVLALADEAYDFGIDLCYRVDPRNDIIERWVRIQNRCSFPVQIDKLGFGSLFLPTARWEVSRPTGSWGREFQIVRHALSPGRLVAEGCGLITGHSANPFFMLNREGQAWEDHGDVWFGALAYSGNWQIEFEGHPSGVLKVLGGYHADHFDLTLAPGAAHATPPFVLGYACDGWSGASLRLHRFARDRVLPSPSQQSELRPVIYNSWEATYFNLGLGQQVELARRAAAMGVELYCVDDGWFGARRSDRAGLGDWTVAADVFPDGLDPLIREVHRLGMKFGIWVEPEMVNPDSDLYRAHPDWVLHYPGRPRTESRHQLVLDFGRSEVVEHIYQQLDALVSNHPIDFIKWDMNRYAIEFGSSAGGEVAFRHVEAVYGLMDRLRRNHPGLSLESCSGGGGRVDLGVFARTDQAWPSDNSEAFHRMVIQEGYSMAYPPRTMECWVTLEHSEQTGAVAPLSTRFDCAMRGALGVGLDIAKLSEEELDECRRRIAFYKRIRPTVQLGDLCRLERIEELGRSVWQSLAPDGREAVISILSHHQVFGQRRPPPRLRGLDPAASYRASEWDQEELGVWSGAHLMAYGIPDNDRAGFRTHGYSRTVLLERVER